MIIKSIVAVGQNNEIGKDNRLIWHLPVDLKFFKSITKGQTVIMGRKSWVSIGSKPLSGRPTIVITRDHDFRTDLATVVHSPEEALEVAKRRNLEAVFILGGAQIYEAFLPVIEVLYITKVDGRFDADTYFPQIIWDDYEVSKDFCHEIDDKNQYTCTFYTLTKKIE